MLTIDDYAKHSRDKTPKANTAAKSLKIVAVND